VRTTQVQGHNEINEHVPKSITFTPSNTISQRLEEFARVAGVTPEKMVSDVLDVQFGPDNYMETLRQYIYDRGNSRGPVSKSAGRQACQQL
jgi:hypothetical protein